MDLKGYLLKQASVLDEIIEKEERNLKVNAGVTKLKQAGIIESEEEMIKYASELQSVPIESLDLVVNTVISKHANFANNWGQVDSALSVDRTDPLYLHNKIMGT